MILLDGKAVAQQLKQYIKTEVENIKKQDGKIPHLAVIMVGNNPASETYINNKIKACKEVGFEHTLIRRSADITEQALIDQIQRLNQSSSITGFIVQLPLPPHINEANITQAIDYKKDIDGFTPINQGKMLQNLPCFLPATPFGILEILKFYNISTTAKHCVVVGRSNIVGTPISILLSRNNKTIGNATVTLCHSHTPNLAQITQQADILIAAIGKPNFITANMVKKNAVVIDVGINRIPDPTTQSGYKIVGDVHFETVAPLCSAITPVPGGVGATTIAALLLNTLHAAQKSE